MAENRRARPMSREDRRAAIAEATVPLLEQHGATVTTRQIAQAAGVAEGTLFKAFDDKRELLMAAAARVFDTGASVREIDALPRAVDLPAELTTVVSLLNATARRVRRIMIAVHALAVAEMKDGVRPTGPTHGPPARDARSRAVQELNDALTRRFDPFRDDLRIPPEALARLLLSVVMGRVPPGIPDDDDLTVDLLVDVLLHGAVA
ncbi:TetR/AcrR family transcriptional regulator [Cellulomonas sp. RIT-PI-Y]|uniref:TetR/AcrR family transcriptional regulator n=1 Tax=Cellulomonas sp. RIT-PI-Y TaxID=3035297 RepID=UPI0021D937DD|nr:TetR/AcrR family transcriptional regulator [Cellulomonas sp. RIT-PI-Y]